MTIDEFKTLQPKNRFKYYSQVWEVQEVQERGLVATLYCPSNPKLHGSHKSFVDFEQAEKFQKI